MGVLVCSIVCYIIFKIALYRYKKANRKELLSINHRNISNEIITAAKMLSDQKYSCYVKYNKNFYAQVFLLLSTMVGILILARVLVMPRLNILQYEEITTLKTDSWELIVIGICIIINVLLTAPINTSRYKKALKTCEREMNSIVNGADKYFMWEQYLNKKDVTLKKAKSEVKFTASYKQNIKDNRDSLKEFAYVTKQNAEKTVGSIQESVKSDKEEDKPLKKVKKHLTGIKTCIITVMPEEFAALKVLLKNIEFLDEETQKYTDLCCCFGEVRGADAGNHMIGLFLVSDNKDTTIDMYAKKLLSNFVQLEHIIICGVAGGVPQKENIGDVVVSTAGLFQYNMGNNWNTFVIRDIGTNCDSFLKQGVTAFSALEFENNSPWKRYIDDIGNKLNRGFATPPEEELFYEFNAITKKYELKNRKGPALPSIHYGRISSGNYVQNDPEKRDILYENENVMAIEVKKMNAHDSKDYPNINYLVICGISDFCDKAVETEFHQYAAAAAAAYTIGLLESMRYF